jgi:hypothetical protein
MTGADLLHKLNTVRKAPWISAQDKTERIVRIIIKSYCRRKLAQYGALNIIAEFTTKQGTKAALPNYHDLWNLYRTVRKRKPKTVLEFGSGCSTVILAKALSDNGAGRLYSVDSDTDLATSTAACIPESFKHFCEITYSPLQEVTCQGTLGFRHEKVPDVIPDFCYLNGPPTTRERKVAVDLLEMEGKFRSEFFLVIDGRELNAQFLRENFKRNYQFHERKFYSTSTFVLREV